MKNNKITYVLFFVAAVVAQWFVPMQMIYHQEDIVASGKVFKFKTAPVDPYDAFRGKYIYLNYDQTTVSVPNLKKYNSNDDIFVLLKDSAGYALVTSISKTQPKSGDYVKAKIGWVDQLSPRKLISIEYPFNRFYMNEYKAKPAETVYAESNRNPNTTTYALIAVKEGEAVVKDVLINEISIKILAKKETNKQK